MTKIINSAIALICFIFLMPCCKKDSEKKMGSIPKGSKVEYDITANDCIDTVRYAIDNKIYTIPEGNGIISFETSLETKTDNDTLFLKAGLGFCVGNSRISTLYGRIKLNGNTVREGNGTKLALQYP